MFCFKGFGLQCYQCDSSVDPDCKENFDWEHLDQITIRPTECTVDAARYCVKTTGVWGGEFNVVLVPLPCWHFDINYALVIMNHNNTGFLLLDIYVIVIEYFPKNVGASSWEKMTKFAYEMRKENEKAP